MQITSVTYTTSQEDKILVRTTRGMLTLPWPDGSPEGQEVQSWIDAGNQIDPSPQPDLSQQRSDKLAEINEGYKQEIQVALAGYPDLEVHSFGKQEREAEAWQADNAAPTPYLDSLRTERTIDKQELVDLVLQKARDFTALHGRATGKRQRLEKQIANATQSQLDNINW